MCACGEWVQSSLLARREEAYGTFLRKLLPELAPERILGVRTPDIRRLAKSFAKEGDISGWMAMVPHDYFEENQLHAFLLSQLPEDEFLPALEAFLPFMDNWATCDQCRPAQLKRHPEMILPRVPVWIASGQTYTIRFAVEMLMLHFLGERFQMTYMETVAGIQSEEYYVNMMIAWYFAEALVRQQEAAEAVLREGCLSAWVQNKAIQKACESRRVPPAQKAYLRALRRAEKGNKG